MSDSRLWGDYTLQSEQVQQQAAVAPRTQNSQIDKNAFLLLLITQMKYQDPMNPMDDKEFVAQMAQFSALEQMQNLNATMSYSQSFSMIGRTVAGQAMNPVSGQIEEFGGYVDSVVLKNGEPYVVIGEAEYKASDVKNVFTDAQTTIAKSMNDNLFNSQNIMLVGKYIQAIVQDGDKPAEFVEGKVDYVKFALGVPILVVGNKEIYPQEVISVADGSLLTGKTVSIEETDEEGVVTRLPYKIGGVTIKDDKAYLQLGDKLVEIEKIDRVIEALKYVGKEIKSLSLNGVADGVLIKDKVPYLTVGDEMIKFSEILK